MRHKRAYLGLALFAAVAIVALAAACGGSGNAASVATPTPGAPRSDAQGGGFVAGTVKSVNGNTVTVTTNNNGDTQFQLSDSATVQKVVDATPFDLVPGKFVTVRGQQNADGTIEAASVQLSDQPPPQRSPGASPRTPRPGRSPRGGPGGFGGGFSGGGGGGVTAGMIKSVGNNSVTVSTTNRGDVVVQLPDSAVIRATVAGSPSDIAAGQTVLARGQKDANGVVVATSVQVGGAGQFGFGGGTQGSGQ